jgi:hypothetical protein
VLQRLGDHIANCFARAVDAERRATEAPNEALRADNELMAKTWRHLAGSYQFVESLERFLLDAEQARNAEKAKGARPPEPPVKMEPPMFPPGRDI